MYLPLGNPGGYSVFIDVGRSSQLTTHLSVLLSVAISKFQDSGESSYRLADVTEELI